MGPGTATSIPTSGGYTYYQSITLTINTQCGSGDTCNDTPSWSISSPANTLQLSPTSGASVTLSKGSSMGNCKSDTPVSVSIGGFSSAAVTFLVNSPHAAITRSDITGTYAKATADTGGGYITTDPISVLDVCGGDLLTTLPWYESFGSWYNPGVIAGWPNPGPTTLSAFNDPDDSTVFVDYIGAHDTTGTWNPKPTFTSRLPPYTYNSVISQAPHSYHVGAGGGTTFTGGVNVFSGTIFYYRDHGDTY